MPVYALVDLGGGKMRRNMGSMWTDDEYKEFEEDIYSREMRQIMLENGEIDSWEEAFLEGYDEA